MTNLVIMNFILFIKISFLELLGVPDEQVAQLVSDHVAGHLHILVVDVLVIQRGWVHQEVGAVTGYIVTRTFQILQKIIQINQKKSWTYK